MPVASERSACRWEGRRSSALRRATHESGPSSPKAPLREHPRTRHGCPASWSRRKHPAADRQVTYAVVDALTSASPPISLRGAAAGAAPRPMLLIAGGAVEEEHRARCGACGSTPQRDAEELAEVRHVTMSIRCWILQATPKTRGIHALGVRAVAPSATTAPDSWVARRSADDLLPSHRQADRSDATGIDLRLSREEVHAGTDVNVAVPAEVHGHAFRSNTWPRASMIRTRASTAACSRTSLLVDPAPCRRTTCRSIG